MKRKGSSSSSNKSPWCRPSRRSYRRVLYYVDTKGYEFPASEIRGESPDKKDAEDSPKSPNKSKDAGDTVEIKGKKYKKVYKRVRMKRAGSSSSKSPWCKPSKARFRQVLFYVDDKGREIEASELMNENGGGEDENSEADSVHKSQSSVRPSTPLSVCVTPSRRTRSISPQGSRAASMSPAQRSSRSQSAGHSPLSRSRDRRTRRSSHSPRSAKSPRTMSRSRSRSQERASTPSRMVNGGSPSRLVKVQQIYYCPHHEWWFCHCLTCLLPLRLFECRQQYIFFRIHIFSLPVSIHIMEVLPCP